MSSHLSSNLVDNSTNNAAYISVKGREFSASHPVGADWVTLRVLNCNYYVDYMPIEVHLRGRTIANHRKDFCIVFDLTSEWYCGAIGSGRENSTEAYIPLTDCGQRDMNQSVLVRISEVPKNLQERGEGWMRAIVRLRPLDSCPNWNANRSKIMPLIDGCIEQFPAITDGKLQPPFIVRRIRESLMNGDSINEMVESTAEIC